MKNGKKSPSTFKKSEKSFIDESMLSDINQGSDIDEGEKFLITSKTVFEVLNEAKPDPKKRKIILNNGKELTVDLTAKKIAQMMGLTTSEVIGHVFGWLKLRNIPEDLTENQRAEFESEINNWVKECDKNSLYFL